VDLEQHDLE